jgi:predicted HTH transcriptional regulator
MMKAPTAKCGRKRYKMTNREFLTAIASNTTIPAELVEYATNAIAKMDAANEARKNKPSKTAIENAPLLDRITTEILGAEAVTAAQVAEVLGVSTQKASSLLRSLVAAGTAVQSEVKGEKGMLKAYTLA